MVGNARWYDGTGEPSISLFKRYPSDQAKKVTRPVPV